MSASLHTPDGKDLELPLVGTTEGAPGADISKLLSTTGLVTFDPGFANTASCTSEITYIDGDAGILRYRGYPIERARGGVDVHRDQLPAHLRRAARPPTSWPTSRRRSAGTRCCTRTSSASSTASRATRTRCPCSPRPCRRCRPSTRTRSTRSTRRTSSCRPYRLLAKLPTIAAYAYKKSVGQPFLYPDNSLGLVENFLRMTFGFPAEPYEVDPTVVRALDLLFILHADHEQNCSTSTVRMVGSSQANLFASVSAGINALFGPLHGGANQAVLEMLERIRDRGRRRRPASSSG